jgi:hypothetical protein
MEVLIAMMRSSSAKNAASCSGGGNRDLCLLSSQTAPYRTDSDEMLSPGSFFYSGLWHDQYLLSIFLVPMVRKVSLSLAR